MRLLSADAEKPALKTFFNETERPEYAILSHTWMVAEDEVSFSDLADLDRARQKRGWKKIQHTILQAQAHDLEWVWVDTCCIDKSSSAELAEAINSMFRWYRDSAICYVYLDDVPDLTEALIRHTPVEDGDGRLANHSKLKPMNILLSDYDQYQTISYVSNWTAWIQEDPPKQWLELTHARWFTRGWTLQELLAPNDAHFFSQDWQILGDRGSLATLIAQACNIPHEVIIGRQSLAKGYMAPANFRQGIGEGAASALHTLRHTLTTRVTSFFEGFSIAQRMSWAAGRRLTRVEDEAYSLLGLFDANMPVLYGEGNRAFFRLQQEIMKTRMDHTIFVWEYDAPTGLYGTTDGALLAPSASCFRNQGNTIQAQFDPRRVYEVNNIGIRLRVPCLQIPKRELTWRDTLAWNDLAHGSAEVIEAVLHCHDSRNELISLALRLNQVAAGDQEIFIVASEPRHGRIVQADALATATYDDRSITISLSDALAGTLSHRLPYRSSLDSDGAFPLSIRLEGQRVNLDSIDLSTLAGMPNAKLCGAPTEGLLPQLFYKRALCLETVCPANLWNIQTQTFTVNSWSGRTAPGLVFLGYITLTCTNAKDHDPNMTGPIILHIIVCKTAIHTPLPFAVRATFNSGLPRRPEDLCYYMEFSSRKQPNDVSEIKFRKPGDGGIYTVQSGRCLPDGNFLEAELSVRPMPTSARKVVVVFIRRWRNAPATVSNKSGDG